MYLALYRKYRPQNFEEVIGQNHITQTLKNQIKTGRIGHAYLFCGSRGTGKTSTAKIFARAINCLNNKDGSPCGKCSVCESLKSNNIDILEIDAASNNGVDEIRDLREKIKYPPVNGKYKVYIVDEVHMLSPSAFNALLKTLEEPPSYAVFILATTEVHKLPATILSRCLRFDFRLVNVAELCSLLERVFKEENISAEKEAIEMIARAGEGSVRDTLSVADRCVSYSGDNLTFKSVLEVLGTTEKETLVSLANTLLKKELGQCLNELDKILASGKSPLVLSKDLISYFRDLLVILTLKDNAKQLVVAREEVFKKMQEQATDENYDEIVSAINTLSEVEAELRYSISPRIVLETAFIKTITNVSLSERVQRLEKLIENPSMLSQLKPSEALVKPTIEKAETSKSAQNNESSSNTSGEQLGDGTDVLGKLLSFLRERKDMSLLSCVRQVKSTEIIDKKIILYLDDQMSLDIINRDKYRQILTEFFISMGLEYQFKVEQKAPKGDVDALSRAFNGRLDIKE